MNYKNAPSGLSSAIQKTMVSLKNDKPLIEKQAKGEFTIKIANTLEEREAAFELGYQIYLEKGYIQKNANQKLIRQYDTNDETVILIVQDKEKNVVGTATLVFDGVTKLPAEKVYGDEIYALKKEGKKTAELCRFVINPIYRNEKEILVLLFNYCAIYIHHVKQYHGLAVEVTPRHKNYYKLLLNFDEIGNEKPCPQVENTVGVLLYLPAEKYQDAISKNGQSQGAEKKARSLYPYFINAAQEKLVAHYLQKQAKPMSSEEKFYFGFSESGISRAVCV
jgi:hypothetical protein